MTQARSLALASRRFPPDDLSTFIANPPPEDTLKTAAISLLPALADRFRPAEAIELYWQAFQRAGRLEDKLQAVARLTELQVEGVHVPKAGDAIEL